MDKLCRKGVPEPSPRPLYEFMNSYETFMNLLKGYYQKSSKITISFFLEPSPFLRLRKTKGACN